MGEEFNAVRTEDQAFAEEQVEAERAKGHKARIVEETIKRGGKKVTVYVVKVQS